jgi:hypothetical protein
MGDEAAAPRASALGRFLDAEDADELGVEVADSDGVVDSLTAAGGDVPPGVCVECEEAPAAVVCDQCADTCVMSFLAREQ